VIPLGKICSGVGVSEMGGFLRFGLPQIGFHEGADSLLVRAGEVGQTDVE
jgi:hypothetical protein